MENFPASQGAQALSLVLVPFAVTNSPATQSIISLQAYELASGEKRDASHGVQVLSLDAVPFAVT